MREGKTVNRIRKLLSRLHLNSEYVKWLVGYSKPFIPRIMFLLLIGFAGSGVSIFLAVVSKRIIDSALSGKISPGDIYLYVGMVFVTIIVTAFTTLVSVVLDERFSFGIRKQLYQKIIESNWMDVTKFHTGDLMTRLTSDAGNIAEGIIYTIPNIVNLLVQMIITFGVLYYYEPRMALFALIIGPIAAVISFLLGRKLKKLQVKVQETESAYRSFLQESLANLLIVKAFCNEEASTDKLIALRENRFYWVRKKSTVGVISSSSMSLTFQLGYIAAFAFGSYQVAVGQISYGTMTVFLTLVNRIQAPVFQLARNIPQIVSMFASVGRVIELQQIELEDRKPLTIIPNNVGVRLNELSFSYSGKEILFEGASAEIKPGDFVAIVGESGIGKTTLIRLIMSFLNPNSGVIEFFNEDGHREPTSASAREFISYVPQGNTLFSGTIIDNVRMGNILATEEEILESLKLASAYEFVCQMPEGVNTVIGEKGHGISEGQAQRIAIARAIVRKAPFMILDEATSALDDETEIAVLMGIKKMVPRPTCMMITHRHSVLPYCNQEIKIKKKEMVITDL